VAEFDRPQVLLADSDGLLSQMVDATGSDAAVNLRRVAVAASILVPPCNCTAGVGAEAGAHRA
jgi:hypothetical protein